MPSLSTWAERPKTRWTSAANGKFRQHGTFGGFRMTPVVGSSGPGAQIPMPLRLECASGCAAKTLSMADCTAAKPAAEDSRAGMATRVWKRIVPSASTRPAATFVPPMSTPRESVRAPFMVLVGVIEPQSSMRIPRFVRTDDALRNAVSKGQCASEYGFGMTLGGDRRWARSRAAGL